MVMITALPHVVIVTGSRARRVVFAYWPGRWPPGYPSRPRSPRPRSRLVMRPSPGSCRVIGQADHDVDGLARPGAVLGDPALAALQFDQATGRAELSAVAGNEPEHLVDLQEDIDLGIGQDADLGFGDTAAHTDGVHLQLYSAPAQHLGQGRARRARTGLELLGLLVHALPVGRIGDRPGGDAPPAGEEIIQRRQVDDGRTSDRFELDRTRRR
jgi:hypothetical protein